MKYMKLIKLPKMMLKNKRWLKTLLPNWTIAFSDTYLVKAKAKKYDYCKQTLELYDNYVTDTKWRFVQVLSNRGRRIVVVVATFVKSKRELVTYFVSCSTFWYISKLTKIVLYFKFLYWFTSHFGVCQVWIKNISVHTNLGMINIRWKSTNQSVPYW